jgi:hypothetical protein
VDVAINGDFLLNGSIAGYDLRRADGMKLNTFQTAFDHTGDLTYAPRTRLPFVSEWNEMRTSLLKIHLEEVTVSELLGRCRKKRVF